MKLNDGYFDNTVSSRLKSWYFLTLFFSYLSLFLNTAIIYDLKKVLDNPFASSEKRVQKYIIAAITLALFFCLIGLGLTSSTN